MISLLMGAVENGKGDEALFSYRAIFLLGDIIIKHGVILSDFNHFSSYLLSLHSRHIK